MQICAKTSFWNSGWVQGRRPRDITPRICSVSRKNNRNLCEVLNNRNWIEDINLQHESFSAQHLHELGILWREVQQVALRTGILDKISWKFSPNGIYSVKSAYSAQFMGSASTNFDGLIWKVWTPRSCKPFSCLAMQNRLWTPLDSG